MAIRCRDMIELPSLKDLKVIAGSEGLDRIIRWVHVIDVPQVSKWVQGGELLFITGLGIKNAAQELVSLIKTIEEKKLSGLVINLGPYIHEVPKEVIEAANILKFPLFELPWKVKIVDVTQEICSTIIQEQIEEKSVSHLVEDMLFSEFKSEQNLIDRALFHGFNIKSSCQVVIVDIDDFAKYIKDKEMNDEIRVLELKNYFKQIINNVFIKYGFKILSMLRSDSAVIIVPDYFNNKENKLRKIIDEIRINVSQQFKGLTVSIGIGSLYSELMDLKKSFVEAELSLKISKNSGCKDKVSDYKELGIFRLLLMIEDKRELEILYREIMGELLDYEAQRESDFITTLESYLDENCNLVKTSEKLHVHRNTLKYRLKRVQEITGKDLGSARDCLSLRVGLMIGRYINLSE